MSLAFATESLIEQAVLMLHEGSTGAETPLQVETSRERVWVDKPRSLGALLRAERESRGDASPGERALEGCAEPFLADSR